MSCRLQQGTLVDMLLIDKISLVHFPFKITVLLSEDSNFIHLHLYPNTFYIILDVFETQKKCCAASGQGKCESVMQNLPLKIHESLLIMW